MGLLLQVDTIAFGKRKAVDKEMREQEEHALPNCVFDESGTMLLVLWKDLDGPLIHCLLVQATF